MSTSGIGITMQARATPTTGDSLTVAVPPFVQQMSYCIVGVRGHAHASSACCRFMFSGGIVAEAHFFTQQHMVVFHNALPKGQDSGLMLQHAMQKIQQCHIGITVCRIYTARFDALGASAQSCLSTSDCSRACLLQGAVCCQGLFADPLHLKKGVQKSNKGRGT